MVGCLISYLPLFSWDRVSHSNLSLQLKCLAREPPPRINISLYPSPGIIGVHPIASFLHGCWRYGLESSCLFSYWWSHLPRPTIQNFYTKVLCVWNNMKSTQTKTVQTLRTVVKLFCFLIANTGSVDALRQFKKSFCHSEETSWSSVRINFFVKETCPVPWFSWELLVK